MPHRIILCPFLFINNISFYYSMIYKKWVHVDLQPCFYILNNWTLISFLDQCPFWDCCQEMNFCVHKRPYIWQYPKRDDSNPHHNFIRSILILSFNLPMSRFHHILGSGLWYEETVAGSLAAVFYAGGLSTGGQSAWVAIIPVDINMQI
jgi:hypothetical protein